MIGAAVAFASTLAGPARASDPSGAAGAAVEPGKQVEPAKQAARERFKKGVKLYDAAEQRRDPVLYESAYLEFAQAYAIYPDEVVLWNLAVSELDTLRFVDALRHLRDYDRTHPALTAEKRAELTRHLEKAGGATAHLAIEAPPGAHILVDDKDVGAAPLLEPLDATPGKHRVAILGRLDTPVLDVGAAAGEVTRVRLVDETDAVTRGATSTPLGATPGAAASSATSTSAVAPLMGQGADVDRPAASPFWTTRRTAGAVVAGAGIASIATGIVFALRTQADADDAAAIRARLGRSSCVNGAAPGCSDLNAAYDAHDRDRALGTGFVAAGAAAVVTGAALLLWPESRWSGSPASASARAILVPVVSPLGAGLRIVGTL